MCHHVWAHAVTGFVRRGTSDTLVIPYWDRDAWIAGTQHLVGHDQAAELVETADVLALNFLRADTQYFLTKTRGLSLYRHILRTIMPLGQQSKQDYSGKQKKDLGP